MKTTFRFLQTKSSLTVLVYDERTNKTFADRFKGSTSCAASSFGINAVGDRNLIMDRSKKTLKHVNEILP